MIVLSEKIISMKISEKICIWMVSVWCRDDYHPCYPWTMC